MGSRLKRIQTAIFLVIGAILIVISSLLLTNLGLTVKNKDLVIHTREVKESSERLISLLKDIETGHRGYLVTHDSVFLHPYQKTHDELYQELAKLTKLTLDNEDQHKRLVHLTDLVNLRLTYIENNIKYFNSAGVNATLTGMLKAGKKVMDSCRTSIKKIQSAENKQLTERNDSLQESISFTEITVLTLIVVTLIFLLVSYVWLSRLQKIREDNEAKISQLNEELSATVEELRASNEETISLNEELRSSNEALQSANELLSNANLELSNTKNQLQKLNSNLEVKLSTFLENNLDLVSYSDENAEVEYVNTTGKLLLGYKESDLSQKVYTPNHVSAEDLEHKIPMIQKAIKDHGSWEGELNLQSLDGETIPFWIKTIAAKNEITGEIYHATLGRDLRKEREVQAKLIENENRYRLLFENNPQPMWIYDFETRRILEANNAACEVYGYTKEEFSTLNINDLRPDSELEKLDQHLQSIASQGYSHSDTWIHKTKSGQLMNVDIRSDGFELNGRIVRLVLSNDITTQLKNEENIRRVNEELIYQNEQLDKYVYVVSHNIRGPIASLLGLTNMLHYEQWSSTVTPVITNIHKVAEKLDDVVKDLNKILSTKNNLNAAKERVQIRVLINDIFEMIHDQIEVSEALFSLQIETDEVLSVRSYLHSIFLNLISNAIKYREVTRPLKIEISVKSEENNLVIKIGDNGMGMDLTKNKDKLFGLYKRFHFHIEGKGLGLHLIKSQVEALGGKISLESEIDKGTMFTIILPLTYSSLK